MDAGDVTGQTSRLLILLAILIGTGIAYAVGMTDFSGLAAGPFIGLPQIFHFSYPTFEIAGFVQSEIFSDRESCVLHRARLGELS
ncbi:hypothetical protein B5K06_29755 [Rhizobium grahamii]|uniref:Uncharacterized protein n=1 Tax=Rhizobium grahamii TaxID=1120045 RepID=A0A370KG21_9HYPH|nr:hypothetical protein B5K06_29755 [Rhizobium grahamii]